MIRLPACLLLLLLAACGEGTGEATFHGYVEGEFIEVAPQVSGLIVDVAVRRGDAVEEGAALFRIDAAEAEAAVAQAAAELERARAQLADLQQGSRPAEIAVIEAQIAEAQASLDNARKEFERQQVLFERRVSSEARLDQAREAVSIAEARLASASRQRRVATLPARSAEIAAGERSVEAARAAMSQARTRLARHAVAAPAAGYVEDVYYEAGEVASAAMPVVSLLPAGRRKVIFFVPEAQRTGLRPADELTVGCDGCPEPLTARLTSLGREAEFTPPVIFSRETRGKLVFRAEALLDAAAADLPIGQPVDVRPAGAAP